MQMTGMLKQNADNADSADNCAKSPSYPISALCAPASRSPAGWGAFLCMYIRYFIVYIMMLGKMAICM